MKILRIYVIQFKREENSDWEAGVIINEDELIIDINGKPVPAPIANYIRQPYNGTMLVYGDIK